MLNVRLGYSFDKARRTDTSFNTPLWFLIVPTRVANFDTLLLRGKMGYYVNRLDFLAHG